MSSDGTGDVSSSIRIRQDGDGRAHSDIHHREDEKNRRKKIHLTLDNFERDDIPEDCPYVLTSPRSLEACKRLGVKPVDLLPLSLEDIRLHLTQEGDLSFETLSLLRQSEEERRDTLESCRALRQQIINEEKENGDQDQLLNPFTKFNCEYVNDKATSSQMTDDNSETSSSSTDIGFYSNTSQDFREEAEVDREPRRKFDYDRLQALLLELTLQDSVLAVSPYSSTDRPEADQDWDPDISDINSDIQDLEYKSLKFDNEIRDLEPGTKEFYSDFQEHHSDIQELNQNIQTPGENNQDLGPNIQNLNHINQNLDCVIQGLDSDIHSFHVASQPSYSFSLAAEEEVKEEEAKVGNGKNDVIIDNNTLPSVTSYPEEEMLGCKDSREFSPSRLPAKNKGISAIIIEKFRDGKFGPVVMRRKDSSNGSNSKPESERYEETRQVKDDKVAAPIERFRTLRTQQKSISRTRSSSSSGRPKKRPEVTAEDVTFLGVGTSIADLSLPEHDRRILRLLALKTAREVNAAQHAHQQHLLWRAEAEQQRTDKLDRERAARAELAERRARQNEEDARRLEEARARFVESQQNLQRLVWEKEERMRRLKEEYGQRHRSKCRLSEESRRIAVEEALKELLARDSQYRKELSSHVEESLRSAEMKRQSRMEQFKESRSSLIASEVFRHRSRLMLLQTEERQRRKRIREGIFQRDERTRRFRESSANRKIAGRTTTAVETRLRREERSQKVLLLKRELDAKLDSWRKQVLFVQAASISRAEERARSALQARSARTASELRLRADRQEGLSRQLQHERSEAERAERARLAEKADRTAERSREREEAKNRARMHAFRMAQLREAVRSPFCSFEHRAARVELELRTTTRQLQ